MKWVNYPFFWLSRSTFDRMKHKRSAGFDRTPERRKPDKMEYDLDEWGIYLADCYASNKKPPPQLIGYSHTITVEQVIRNVIPRQSWYLSNDTSIPIMVDPKRRYQDQLMKAYWSNETGRQDMRKSIKAAAHI